MAQTRGAVAVVGGVAVAWLAATSPACDPQETAEADACDVLFGRPNDRTGLDASRCRPSCRCGDEEFAPPRYDAAFTEALVATWELSAPYKEILEDPYLEAAPDAEPPEAVCALVRGDTLASGKRAYTLATYDDEAAARAAGAALTHFGRCGVCSTLENLAVYIREEDLTEPVRACGLSSKTMDEHVTCLRGLGFDRPCAQIWYWNTLHTKKKCLGPCVAALGAPYHDESGALNECLACDERESGAVFKAVAGRTRRNSGLPNAMCRPCSEVRPLVHAY
ncbi:MAG: hypothetical protein FJ095_18380 [Deltaproteobacteria bacterium]|nr:hypothetical protein [Deltaproteobacteria bacterium]